MRLIPAIDIIGSKCVRLTQGDYDSKKEYDQSPVDVAKDLEKRGFEYLHVVDLEGAKGTHPKNLTTLNQIALATDLKIDFGGGIKSEDSLVQALRSGAQQINIGSLAIRNPNLVKFWLMRYSPDQIIISADAKDKMIAIDGWTKPTFTHLFEYIDEFADAGAKYFVCTDISKDGMMQGSAVELYDEIIDNFPNIKLVASGGISSIEELKQLEDIGVEGAIIGKAIYEGLIDLDELIQAFR